jgi:hypothetical protein
MKQMINIILSFLLAALIFLFFLDFFIRETHIVDPNFNDLYEDIGRGRRAGLKYASFNEGFSLGQFNKFRYLGPGYNYSKEKGVIRIALLGDSYVEGFQVFDRDHFRNILEEELQKKIKQKVEVLNFGRSGFDIGDMYCYNETIVRNFNPDYSLFFVAQGDVKPKFSDPLRLKVKLSGDSLLIYKGYPEDFIRKYNASRFLIQNSTIMNMLNNCKKTAESKGFAPILLDKFYKPFMGQNNLDLEHADSKSDTIPEITIRILQHLDYQKDIIVNRDITGLDENFVSLVKDFGLTYINLQDTLINMKQNGIEPNFWKATKKYGHWNPEAHRAVAEYIANQLTSRNLISD